MEIYIMRHGEPDIPRFPDKISSKEFLVCLEIYKSCGISALSKPRDGDIDIFKNFNAIVSSDLKRSVDSARFFSSGDSLIIDSMFREIEDSFIPIPFVKLPPATWSRIFILLWFLRFFEFKRAFKEGRARAANCARKLASLAEEHGKVLFVGHGFMNIYIARELNVLGWKGPKIPSRHYWDYAAYQKGAS